MTIYLDYWFEVKSFQLIMWMKEVPDIGMYLIIYFSESVSLLVTPL